MLRPQGNRLLLRPKELLKSSLPRPKKKKEVGR